MLLEGEDLYALDIAQASGPIIERFTKANTFVFSTNLPPFPTSLPTGWTQDYSDKKKRAFFLRLHFSPSLPADVFRGEATEGGGRLQLSSNA